MRPSHCLQRYQPSAYPDHATHSLDGSPLVRLRRKRGGGEGAASVIRAGRWYIWRTMRKRGRPRYPDILTPREWEVLSLLRERLTNEQIAERLGVTLHAARYHVSQILSKLAVATREEAAAWQPDIQVEGPTRFRAFQWALGVAAVVVLAALGLLIWGVLRGTESNEAEVNATPVVSCPAIQRIPAVWSLGDNHAGPRLAESQIAEAHQIAEADPIVRSIECLTSYTIQGLGPWVEHDQLVGVYVEARLISPQTIEATMPYVERDENGDAILDSAGKTIISTRHCTIDHLEVFDMLIDLAQDRLATVDPVTYHSLAGPC